MMFDETFAHKLITYRFAGKLLRFKLSQGLFSSNDIDTGTRFLLQVIKNRLSTSPPATIIDSGCGTGIIGICLASLFPGAEILMEDRDALAVSFAEHNTGLNKDVLGDENTAAIQCSGGLLLGSNPHTCFDLVVSNIPAKAGKTALEAYVINSLLAAGRKGRCACVIVNTLAAFFHSTILKQGGQVEYTEKKNSHTVFFYSGDCQQTWQSGLAPYIRGTMSSNGKSVDTVYNIDEFDNMSIDTGLAMKMIDRLNTVGDCIIWHPGQGHMPLYARDAGAEGSRISIASRDLLALRISEKNMIKNGGLIHASFFVPGIFALPYLTAKSQFDTAVIRLQPVPGSNWSGNIEKTVNHVLTTKGRAVIYGKSSHIGRLLREKRQFTLYSSKKQSGMRAVIIGPKN